MVYALIFLSICFGQSLEFKNHGQKIKTLSLKELKALVPPQVLKLWEPHERKEVDYDVIKFDSLLQKVYGKNASADEFLFTCVDGYQPAIAAERFLNKEAYVAFGRRDQKKFAISDQDEGGRIREVGPYYLVWKNLDDQTLRQSDVLNWPFGIKTVDRVSFKEQYPKISPPDQSSMEVLKGFQHFRNNCLVCHALNGNGGNRGPELNYPVNVTEYFKESMLHQWISDPTSIRYNTVMPPLKKIENRDQVIQEIIEYLKAMTNKKIKPT